MQERKRKFCKQHGPVSNDSRTAAGYGYAWKLHLLQPEDNADGSLTASESQLRLARIPLDILRPLSAFNSVRVRDR